MHCIGISHRISFEVSRNYIFLYIDINPLQVYKYQDTYIEMPHFLSKYMHTILQVSYVTFTICEMKILKEDNGNTKSILLWVGIFYDNFKWSKSLMLLICLLQSLSSGSQLPGRFYFLVQECTFLSFEFVMTIISMSLLSHTICKTRNIFQ